MYTKTYIVDGYRGWDDWESKQDNNFHDEFVFDSRFSKKDVEKMLEIIIFNPERFRSTHFRVIEKGT